MVHLNRFLRILSGSSLLLAASWAGAQNNSSPTNPIPVHVPRPAFQQFHAVPPVNNPITPGFPTLVFDAELKTYDAKPGEMTAPFTFHLTNVWKQEVVITQVHPSCGCTTAKLPPTPWHIPPGGTGDVQATVNLAGKMGSIIKTLTFYTSVGNRIVSLRVNIPPAGASVASAGGKMDRKAAMAQAAADPIAIFRGDCAKCHVDKGVKAMGQDLYAADCGICHESPQRASMVPDLHALRHPTNYQYWQNTIAFGHPHTMMPGFARSQGGPLSDEQIVSLANYLDRIISHNTHTGPSTNAALPSLHTAALP
jgi:mono/diheme cytochrome c family protein